MTRRIVLTLAEDTGTHHCGRCSFVQAEQHGPMASGHPLCGAFGGKWLTTNGGLPRRLNECLDAEREADRMVEIPPDFDAHAPLALASEPIDVRLRWAEQSNRELRKLLHAVDRDRARIEARKTVTRG